MTDARPPVDALEPVPSDALVFRFVQPAHIDPSAPVGAQLQMAALQTNEFTPNEHSYGASVYVKSRLPRGLTDLLEACPKWQSWRTSEVPVKKVLDLGVKVVLSPQDCEFEAIRVAHASLIGVDKLRRNKLVRLIESHMLPAS
jgi:hypothetical protein